MQLRPHDRQCVLSSLFLLILSGCSALPNTPAPIAPAATKTPSTGTPSKSTYPALPAANSGRGGYYLDDGPGDSIPDGLQNTPDAEPRVEPYAKRGNNPYVVFGTRYTPLISDQPFTQRGYGSWYGKKFHGQKTSSGELYDMYKMTAASPILPIPSYARVTNLSNGKQVIVRVNDRGPFRSSRIIDLSYTAALKLGYVGHGSAELEVERLLPADIERIRAAKGDGQPIVAQAANVVVPVSSEIGVPTVETAPLDPLAMKIATLEPVATSPEAVPVAMTVVGGGFYLQFGAYSQMANAEIMRSRLLQDLGSVLPQLKVEPSNNLYRLYSGPFATREAAASAALQVQQAGVTKPFILQR
jgi:rare lipoprotein A